MGCCGTFFLALLGIAVGVGVAIGAYLLYQKYQCDNSIECQMKKIADGNSSGFGKIGDIVVKDVNNAIEPEDKSISGRLNKVGKDIQDTLGLSRKRRAIDLVEGRFRRRDGA